MIVIGLIICIKISYCIPIDKKFSFRKVSCCIPTDHRWNFLSRKVPVLVAAAQYLQKTAQKILTAKDCTENMNGSVSSVISVKKYFGDYIEAKLDENIFNSHE